MRLVEAVGMVALVLGTVVGTAPPENGLEPDATSGTTGLGSTGLSGGSSGGPPPTYGTYIGHTLTPEDGSEHKALTSWFNEGGTATNLPKHVFQIRLRYTGGKWEIPHPGSPVTNFYSSGTRQRDTPPPTLYGAGTSPGGPPDPWVWTNGHSYYAYSGASGEEAQDYAAVGAIRGVNTVNTLYVVAPAELGVAGTANTVHVTPGGTVKSALSKVVADNDLIPVHHVSSGTLPSGTVTVMIHTLRSFHVLEDYHDWYTWTSPTQLVYSHTTYFWGARNESKWTRYDFDIRKLLCDDASIDTRKTHGQPNLDGELPGDPNAEPRNVNFSPWHWKGGLFAGNMPWSSGDLSGRARAQFYPAVATLYPAEGSLSQPYPRTQFAVLSLLHLGAPGSATDNATLRAGVPGPNDPKLNHSESTVTWEHRWSLSGMTFGPDVTLSNSTPVDDYVNFKTTLTDQTPLKVCLSLTADSETNPADTPLPNLQVWRYFASKEYQALFPNDFPQNDSQPRVWVVDQILPTGVTQTWGDW